MRMYIHQHGVGPLNFQRFQPSSIRLQSFPLTLFVLELPNHHAFIEVNQDLALFILSCLPHGSRSCCCHGWAISIVVIFILVCLELISNTHTHSHTHSLTYTLSHTLSHTHTHTHIHTHTLFLTHKHTHTHTFSHTYSHTLTHTFSHKHTHTYSYTPIKHIHFHS